MKKIDADITKAATLEGKFYTSDGTWTELLNDDEIKLKK